MRFFMRIMLADMSKMLADERLGIARFMILKMYDS